MRNAIFFKSLMVLLCGAGILLACQKEDHSGTSERFRLLTAHPWTYDSIYTVCADPEIRYFVGLLHQSAVGKKVRFTSDFGFLSPFESGKWKFSNNESELIMYDADEPGDILLHSRIDLLTQERLELTDLGDLPPTDTCYLKTVLVY